MARFRLPQRRLDRVLPVAALLLCAGLLLLPLREEPYTETPFAERMEAVPEDLDEFLKLASTDINTADKEALHRGGPLRPYPAIPGTAWPLRRLVRIPSNSRDRGAPGGDPTTGSVSGLNSRQGGRRKKDEKNLKKSSKTVDKRLMI